MRQIKGGVTAAKGFQAASTAAGIKYKTGRKDMALLYSETPCNVAGTFTTNLVKAAPVKWDQKVVSQAKRHRQLSSMRELQMPVPEKREWATVLKQHKRQALC